jgi:hypothetical protein
VVRWGTRTILLVCLALTGAGFGLLPFAGNRTLAAPRVTEWAPPGTRPLPDAEAAALVTPMAEIAPQGAEQNSYVPSRAQLAAFRAARNSAGQTAVEFNPLLAYVTGRPGDLVDPSTDDLIQWVSHKWGIPTNLIRAQMFVESRWRQDFLGDRTVLGPEWYALYPPQARVPGGGEAYQSMGIAQVKWTPDGAVGAGTEPLRWLSTAFNLDYYAATLRYYYDGACNWCGPDYSPAQGWKSAGAWYSPEPWDNEGAQAYIRELQQAVGDRAWIQLGDWVVDPG